MIIRCIAHAKFLFELENGYRIVTDPYDASTGYPVTPLRADAVLVSHGHHDHSAVETIDGWTKKIDSAGTHTLAPEITVDGIDCYHDDAQGAKRGPNTVFVIHAEGLNVAHFGDIGHLPDEALCRQLGRIDVALVPVGGDYTIGPAQALELKNLIKPRVLIPMHYRTSFNAQWPIAPLENFTSLLQTGVESVDLLRVTKDDLECQPEVINLRPQAGKA